MPIEANYKTYYGIHLYHYNYSWGGNTYNKLLTQDYPSEELISSASTNDTEAKFLYPKLVGNPTYIDGVAEGHFTLYNSSSAASATLDNYTVTLIATDNVPDNERELGSYSHSLATVNIIAKTGDTWYTWEDGGHDEDLSDTIVLPIYIPITKQKITVDEKLILKIQYTSTGGTVWIAHYNGTPPDDIKIKIPYAPAG